MPLPVPCRAIAIVAAAAVTATACGATPPAPPDPASAGASVPALSYRSVLTGYFAPPDDKPTPWRKANEQAAAFGGWRAYAREAQASAPAASSATSPVGRSAP